MFSYKRVCIVVATQRYIHIFCSNEVKRNRDRILEINYFIDNQREEWSELYMALTDNMDPDAVALLTEEF